MALRAGSCRLRAPAAAAARPPVGIACTPHGAAAPTRSRESRGCCGRSRARRRWLSSSSQAAPLAGCPPPAGKDRTAPAGPATQRANPMAAWGCARAGGDREPVPPSADPVRGAPGMSGIRSPKAIGARPAEGPLSAAGVAHIAIDERRGAQRNRLRHSLEHRDGIHGEALRLDRARRAPQALIGDAGAAGAKNSRGVDPAVGAGQPAQSVNRAMRLCGGRSGQSTAPAPASSSIDATRRAAARAGPAATPAPGPPHGWGAPSRPSQR